MYGVTAAGNSVVAHVHGFKSYFYVRAPPNFKPEDVEGFKNMLNGKVKRIPYTPHSRPTRRQASSRRRPAGPPPPPPSSLPPSPATTSPTTHPPVTHQPPTHHPPPLAGEASHGTHPPVTHHPWQVKQAMGDKEQIKNPIAGVMAVSRQTIMNYNFNQFGVFLRIVAALPSVVSATRR